MKLKNRIIVGFMMVILVPLLLFAAACLESVRHSTGMQPIVNLRRRHPMILQFPIREAVRQESRS